MQTTQIPVLNQSHPLNRGLIAWYLVWPVGQLVSRFNWGDLCGLNPLSMTGGFTSTYNFGSGAGRLGSRGCLQMDASANPLWTRSSARRTVNINAPQSISAWLSLDLTSGVQSVTSIDSGGFSAAIQLEIRSSTLRATAPGGGAIVDSGFTPNTVTWYHLLYTWDGTTNRIYVNGVEKANSVTAHGAGVADRIRVGDTGFSEGWNGRLDDIRYWTRCLTPADAHQVYWTSMQGYPGLFATQHRTHVKKIAAQAATATWASHVTTSRIVRRWAM